MSEVEVTIRVEGMSCGGCERNVTGVLMALPGVASAEVHQEESEARVRFDPSLVSMELMRQAIVDAGFDTPD